MSRRLPSAIFVATVVMLVATVWFERFDADLPGILVIGGWLTLLSLVALVVTTKLPSNAVGWLMAAGASVMAFHLLCTGYAKYALEVEPGSLPLGMTAAWMSLWLGGPAVSLFVAVFLLFPNGRLLSPRWKPLLGLLGVTTLLVTLGYAAKPGAVDNIPTVDNPVRFWGGETLYRLTDGLFQAVVGFVALSAIVSLFLRMRRASGVEREQLKWFVYAVAVFPLFFLSAMAVDAVLDAQLGPGDHYVDFLLIMLGATLIPVAMGVSILKYRLYDIDVIVNRTLVYAALTALLGGTYLGSIVVLQRVLPLDGDSDLAVAASTLAVAGLFQPVRKRLQSFIDRRFYRRKYDAAETLGQFSTRLRSQVDLDSLTGELVSVVGRTMQPAHASLWLRAGGPR